MDDKVVRNELIEELWKKHQYEILRFPMHWSDQMCVNSVRTNANTNVIYAVAMMKGIIPIVTIGCYKSFIADFSKKPKRSLPKYLKRTPKTDDIEKKIRNNRNAF